LSVPFISLDLSENMVSVTVCAP